MKNMVERNGHKVKRDVRLVAIFLLVIMLLSGCSPRHTHQYDRQVLDEKYRVSAEVNCLEYVSYYMSCSCGEVGEETFVSEEIGAHVFSKKTADMKYLKADATLDSPEEYYKSCELCGAAGTETFFTLGFQGFLVLRLGNDQCHIKHVLDGVAGNYREVFTNCRVKLLYVAHIVSRYEYGRDARGVSRHSLLTKTADGKRLAVK